MKSHKRWIWAAVFGAAVFVAILKVRGTSNLRYQTRCELLASQFVGGYVSNQSQDAYQVNGQVQFVFSSAGSVSHPQLAVAADGLVPPGGSVRVAYAHMAFQLSPGETCGFDVESAIRKL
jgi:hypothetical protein